MDLNEYLAKPNKTIREHTDDLQHNFEVLTSYYQIPKELVYLIKEAIEYHDYGKVNKYFQKRIKKIIKSFNSDIEVAHNLLSLFFIPKEKFKEDNYYKVAYSIMNHHQRYDNYRAFEDSEDLLEDNLGEFEDYCQMLEPEDIGTIKSMGTNIEAQLIKGFLHKCDYSASGGYDIEYPNDFLVNGLNKLGYKWRELQEYTLENRDENLIIIANTGMGKTEAGLLWIGDNKGFFILPLRTALNAMYKRIKDNIVIDKVDERLALLHSNTVSVYMDESVVEEDKIIEYQSKGKNLSMPLTISTLDQLFDFVYRYNGFELKLATFSYSKIVLDEIQAYSADLVAYILSGLEMIHKVGGKFAIITATLPPFIQSLLEEKVGKIKSKSFVKGEDRHHLEIIEKKINSSDIEDFYRRNQGKVLVVCNTIKQAQELYKELDGSGFNLNLLHSKFIKKQRSDKEDRILHFGKTEHIDNGIWISTSLVEASLDIDFDYLFTELNDLNGLFQRLGRVNRKGLKVEMLDKPNAFVYTEINKNLLINGNRGFIDSDIYQLSKEILVEFNQGILKEEMKAEMIRENFTLEKLQNSDFVNRVRSVTKYIDELYNGEKSLEDVKKYFRNIVAYNVIPKAIFEDENIKYILKKNEDLLKEKYIFDKSLNKEENKLLRDKFFVNQQKIRNEIEKYTVSVGIYDLNKTDDYINTGYENIPIVNCEYDEEIGFIRVKNEKKDNTDNFDAFF